MPENPMDAVTWNFTQEQFLQALDDAKHEQAKAIEEHCSKARALNVTDQECEASNSKFAAQASVFVGASQVGFGGGRRGEGQSAATTAAPVTTGTCGGGMQQSDSPGAQGQLSPIAGTCYSCKKPSSSSAFYWHSKDKIVALHTAP